MFTRVVAAAIAVIAAASPAQAQNWKPTKNTELIVGTAAGGTQDRIVRAMHQIIEKNKMVPTTVTVVNKPGAARDAAISYMNTHRQDPHYYLLVTSSWQNDAIINNDTASLNEVTPVMSVVSSTTTYMVGPNSTIKGASDIIERLKKDPGSVTFSMSAAPGAQNWLTVIQFALKAGADPKKLRIAHNASGSETNLQVMGGHADIGVGGLDATLPLHESGKARIIGVLTPQRVGGGAASIPTMVEQGVDAISANWYAMAGGKGIPADAVAYWENVFRQVINTEDFKKLAAQNFWTPEGIGNKDFQAFLKKNEDQQKGMMMSLGLIK